MRPMRFAALFMLVATSACVGEDPPRAYAQRAHPECADFRVESHVLDSPSQTEVSMVCGDGAPRRSIAVKCIFGWGVFSDTTCHENN